jgi:hypothetical protein
MLSTLAGNIACSNNGNKTPKVSVGGPYIVDEDHGFEQKEIQLSATTSGFKGDDLSYVWTIESGVPYASLSEANTRTPTFHAPPEVDSTSYVILKVQVTDNHGNTGFNMAVVVVNPYDEIAHKYMPTLKFEDGDSATYYPVDCAFDGDFDVSNNEASYDEIAGNPAEPVWVYIHEVKFEGMTYLEYWYYYVYNNYFNKHSDDWELMIVVLDSNQDPVKVRYGSHGSMQDFLPDEVEWDGTHPIAYVEEGGHAMDFDTGIFPGGNPFHTWEGVGYIANWYEFDEQHTFFGDWYGDSDTDTGTISSMQAGGYVYRDDSILAADNGFWPAEYDIDTPWSEKPIWRNPNLSIY